MPPQLFSVPSPCTSATNRPRPLGNPHVLSWAAVSGDALRIDRTTEGRNINLLSIDYAFQPRLRFRLTLGGITFPRNPQVYGEKDFHLLYRYSYRHNHLIGPQPLLPVWPVSTYQRSPTAQQHRSVIAPVASVPCLSPVHYRRPISRWVSYYALFK